jgi:hypothetical protein
MRTPERGRRAWISADVFLIWRSGTEGADRAHRDTKPAYTHIAPLGMLRPLFCLAALALSPSSRVKAARLATRRNSQGFSHAGVPTNRCDACLPRTVMLG